MSVTGAFVIAAVCFARFLLKRTDRIIAYCLWAVVAVRLVFPFSIESGWSIVPFNAQLISAGASALSENGIPAYDYFSEYGLSEAPVVKEHSADWYMIGAYMWLAGFAAMFLHGLTVYHRLKRKMRGSVCIRANIYESETIKSPFVLGFLMPKIYLPAGLSSQICEYVLLHEKIHVKRCDHIVKFIAYFILCLHWFNPLVWLAFRLMGADMEMSCDERVLKEMGRENGMDDLKTEYSLSLVKLATRKVLISGSPITFGESDIKKRVNNVLRFKEKSKVISGVAVTLAIIFGVSLMMSQAQAVTPQEIPNPAVLPSSQQMSNSSDIPKNLINSNAGYIAAQRDFILHQDDERFEQTDELWAVMDVLFKAMQDYQDSFPISQYEAQSIAFNINLRMQK